MFLTTACPACLVEALPPRSCVNPSPFSRLWTTALSISRAATSNCLSVDFPLSHSNIIFTESMAAVGLATFFLHIVGRIRGRVRTFRVSLQYSPMVQAQVLPVRRHQFPRVCRQTNSL